MSLKGQLSEFSLPELFQVIELGRKTGSLVIRIFNTADRSYEKNHIFFSNGQVIALSDLSNQDLLSLTQNYQLLDQKFTSSLLKLLQKNPLQIPLGDYLKSRNLLDAEQIDFLFQVQTINPISQLFKLENAWFHFDDQDRVDFFSQTGLTISPRELSLIGLRTVEKHPVFADKLPELTSGLISNYDTQSYSNLTPLEEKVFSLSNGLLSLNHIAKKLDISPEEIQRVAFSLVSTGLAEELPIVNTDPLPEIKKEFTPKTESTKNKSPNISRSFLSNLKGFFHSKASQVTVKH